MSDKVGIAETSEAIIGALRLARKIIQIRKEGIAGLPKLAALYGDVKAGIEGGDKIPAEMKDIDADEAKALLKLLMVESGGLLEEFDAEKKFQPYLLLAAEGLEAGEVCYAALKPIVEKAMALRAPKA